MSYDRGTLKVIKTYSEQPLFGGGGGGQKPNYVKNEI